jgi:hypothetical protein
MTTKTTKVITVHVTQTHIDHGVRRDCYRCPVAQALVSTTRRRGQLDWRFAVEDNRIELDNDVAWFRATITNKLRRWIKRFDEGKKVKPFTVTLHFFGEIES